MDAPSGDISKNHNKVFEYACHEASALEVEGCHVLEMEYRGEDPGGALTQLTNPVTGF